ncbi:MAG TPA: hypothetical protein VKB35_11965 [Ktedonobacteraceae bacterium]|nr:hypothetical protein [Ktedonobacteraceae bacterium]
MPHPAGKQFVLVLEWSQYRPAVRMMSAVNKSRYKPDAEAEYTFSGKRIGRRNRLYRTKDGKIMCADVNGSYNILRKRKPDAFANADAKGLAAYVVQPVRLAIIV